MGVAASHNPDPLEVARQAARDVARRRGDRSCSIVDVRAELADRGIELEWGNWAGSIFKEEGWHPVGITQTQHKGSHARVVRVWRLG